MLCNWRCRGHTHARAHSAARKISNIWPVTLPQRWNNGYFQKGKKIMLTLCAHLKDEDQFREEGGSYIMLIWSSININLNPSSTYLTQCSPGTQNTFLHWCRFLSISCSPVDLCLIWKKKPKAPNVFPHVGLWLQLRQRSDFLQAGNLYHSQVFFNVWKPDTLSSSHVSD